MLTVQRDVDCLKKIFLNLSTEITFVTKHHILVIIPYYVIDIMDNMDACCCHIIRMYDPTYSIDCMKVMAVVIQGFGCTISPIRSTIQIITSYGTSFCPCILSYLYWLGINVECILGPINGNSHLPTYFFGKTSRQFTPYIELSAAYQGSQILLALIVQLMKEQVFTVEIESLGGYTQSNDFKVGKLRTSNTTWYVPSSFTQFLAKSLLMSRILTKFVVKLCISSAILLSSLTTTNN